MFIVFAHNWDGHQWHTFKTKDEAATFVSEYLFKNSGYGGEVKVIEGEILDVVPKETVKVWEIK